MPDPVEGPRPQDEIPLANRQGFRAGLLRDRRRDQIWLGAFLIFLGIMPAEFAVGAFVSVALIAVGTIVIIVGWSESRSKPPATAGGSEQQRDDRDK